MVFSVAILFTIANIIIVIFVVIVKVSRYDVLDIVYQ